MQRQHVPYLLLTALCAVYVGLSGFLHPINNWDLIGYIASALRNSGMSGAELHVATYAELRRSLPPDQFAELTEQGAYFSGVYRDPEALKQHLPFYRIRPLYVLLVQGLAAITQSLTLAIYVISAVSAAGLCLLTGWLLRQSMPVVPWIVAGAGLVVVLSLGSVVQLARLSTPDALFSLCALAALASFYRARSVAMGLVMVLPLIRTDAVILSVLVAVLLLVERDRRVLYYVAVAVSGALYLWVNAYFGNYGHAVLFNFSLIPGQRTPYPATLEVAKDVSVYLEVYQREALAMLTRWIPYILLSSAGAAAFERFRKGRIGPEARLALVAIAYVVLHFLAFPLGEARHYAFALILCSVYVAGVLAEIAARSDKIG